MALRKQTNPREMDLQPEMRDILMRNGMQAHIIANGSNYQLAVQGHDSPLLTYDLTQQQMLALTDWGSNSVNKKAYHTFTSIIANDFDMPRNFVHARNANGRVAMGLHGYRTGTGEYGRGVGRGMWGPGLLGWTPRQQEGFHLRRVGGQVFYQGAPMVAERPDGRLKPGELSSGSYGFYYKGNSQQQTQTKQEDVLQALQTVVTPVQQRPRSQEPAIPYNALIASDVYFSNEKWQQILDTHGIIIDEQAKTLTIQSDSTDMDMVYDLTDDELKALTDNSITATPISNRLNIINNVIGADFNGKVTMDMLNDTDRLNIELKPEVAQQLQTQFQQQSQLQNQPQVLQQELQQEQVSQDATPQAGRYQNENTVDGRDLAYLNESKGFYREGKHGREIEVASISVEKLPTEKEGKEEGRGEGKEKTEDRYRMTAVINGQTVSHDISQKQYEKFLALDDYHRMKLFAKVFPEVDMKNRPGMSANVGAQILGALTAGLYVAGDIAHGIHRLDDDDHPGRDRGAVRVYAKAGVDTPEDIAARKFEALSNQADRDIRHGRTL